LKKVDPKFAIDVKKFCEKDKWFEYFLNLRNPEAHTGKITPFPFIKLKAVRNMKVKTVFEKIKGEIPEPLEERVPQKSAATRDDAIQEAGLYLPHDPKESDPKKRTCKREIKFSDYHVDLSRRINFLFTEFYKEIDNERAPLGF